MKVTKFKKTARLNVSIREAALIKAALSSWLHKPLGKDERQQANDMIEEFNNEGVLYEDN